MPRTVVPPTPTARLRERGGSPQPERETSAEAGDSLPEKLVKYVPAETLAFFVPAAAAIGSDREGLLVGVLVISALGTIGYLWLQAPTQDREQRPLLHSYVLAVIAFACWAIATAPNVADLIGADDIAAGLVLLGAVFMIPLADSVLNRLQGRGTL